MFLYNVLQITAETTADQIAAALGCEHVAIDLTYELFYNGSAAAGFAVSGIGTDTLTFYCYFNGTVSQYSSMTAANNLYFYKKAGEMTLMTADYNSPQVKLAMIKGIDGNDGSEMWAYYSRKTMGVGTSEYGYVFDKLSTSAYTSGSNVAKRSDTSFLSMCPIFNPDTGFFATAKAYYAMCYPKAFNIWSSYDLIIDNREFLAYVPGQSTTYYVSIVFDVTT